MIYALIVLVFGAVFAVELIVHSKAQEAWAEERANLLDRIQKPEMVGLPEVEISRQYASIDDDEDLLEATRDMKALDG